MARKSEGEVQYAKDMGILEKINLVSWQCAADAFYKEHKKELEDFYKHDKEAFDSNLMELNKMIATKEDGALAYALLLSAMDAVRIEKEAEDAVRANEKKIQAAAWMRRYVHFKNGK